MRIELNWRGPLGVGRFPADPQAVDALNRAAVYLRIKRYAGGRSIAYVGQSRTLIARIDQHLTALLGLARPLRDDAGIARMGAASYERLACYNDLDAAVELALAEAKRMAFYFAPCGDRFDADALSLVEALIKERLEAQALARNAMLGCENRNAIPFAAIGEPVTIDNDFSALDDAGAAVLAGVLGRAPILRDDDPDRGLAG